MAINKDDYIEGLEHYGDSIRKTKGWVNSIRNDGVHFYYSIQADDGYKGHRGTIIYSELGKVEKLEDKERIKYNSK